MYRLIAIDLDGTLLDDKKRIPNENIEVINKLIKTGYEVVIATGRRYWSAKELTKEINSHMVILANNGNVIRNSENDEILATKYLNIKDFRIVMKEGKKRNLHPIIHMNGFEEGFDIIIEYDKDHESYYNYLQDDNRYRRINNYLELEDERILALVYAGKREELYSFKKEIKDKYPNIYNAHIMEKIQLAEALLEIMNPLGTKWLSLEDYAKNKNIKPEEIIAIGDDNNDIDMIKNVGLGIVMKNGTDGVKKVADIITKKDNNESGVAFELKRVLDI